MPVIDKEIDTHRVASILANMKLGEGIKHCILEKSQAMPKQGVSSTFKFGRNFGIIEGTLSALGIPFTLVRPTEWCKVIHEGTKAGGDPKARSRMAVSRLFPNVDLKASDRCRIQHEGMVDAILLAEYGRRKGY